MNLIATEILQINEKQIQLSQEFMDRLHLLPGTELELLEVTDSMVKLKIVR